MGNDCLLEITGISKRFSGVKALDNVTFKMKRGEVRALIGENGAGKSTLIKILSGIHTADSGTIYFDNGEVALKTPRDAQDLGIATVHQELNLVPSLTVSENVFMGRLPYQSGIVDYKKLHADTEQVFKRLGVKIEPTAVVRTLGVAKRQFVEIAKALSQGAKLVIMDEPTSSLSVGEAENLFSVIKTLQASGITFIYVSHKLEELFEIADSVTVLRDGQYVETRDIEDCTMDNLVELMVGRELTTLFPKVQVKLGEPVLHVENLSRAGEFENISFTLNQGEILGVSGLVGAGRTELARCLYGITKADSGQIYMHGQECIIRKPLDAVNQGICLVPEDRKSQGLVLKMSVQHNTSLAILSRLKKLLGLIDSKKETDTVNEAVSKLQIKTPGIKQLVGNLSGGNQQKVVLAKEVLANPDVLILDEPTRGVDVGAKAEIHRLIGAFVQNGGAVLMISSELPEILGMSDRILVMSKGRIVQEFKSGEATQEKILSCAL